MIIGIDLGTTNSLAAVWKDGKAQLIPNALGKHMTPSVVSLDENNQLLVGDIARERLVSHPNLTAATFKRYMGSDKTTKLGKKSFRPEELSSLVLKSLKEDAEAMLGESVTEAIITVPAYFNDTQRKATRLAGELAGLKVERLLNEPTAAAMAYGLHNREKESQFLVFDLGGGTFDVSILEIFEGIMEVHATAGDNHLGGEDFVDALIHEFLSQKSSETKLTASKLEEKIGHLLWAAAEKCKRQLTDKEIATMSVPFNNQVLEMEVSREKLISISKSLLDRVRKPIEQALRDARMRIADLDEIVLVGGATRMPIIQSLVAKMFGRLPNRHIDPDSVIAIGAAVQAGLKARDCALDEVVMTDVCPYSLGIETVREFAPNQFVPGIYTPIIERNTVIPTSRVERFCTVQDRQAKLAVKVYQGESHNVQDNIFLGEVEVKVPRKAAGEETVDVRFTYDINGLLEVEATVVSEQTTKTLIIQETPGRLSEKEIAKRLEELKHLKTHPRDQAANKAVIARAERLYEQTLGDTRESVGNCLNHFMHILQRQNPKEIESVRIEVIDFLDQIEDYQY